ncbi:MAG TPA: DUF2569 domain-containing protein, partial [Clostridia bacterium]|nr:DUF2569 domain-containing protein [Clostridia bacterium]
QELRPPEIKDHREFNVLVVTEQYEVRDLWKWDSANQRYEAAFYADSLSKLLTDPNTRLRTMPLRLPYPQRREQEVVVCLPEKDWNIAAVDKVVDCNAFAFKYQRRAANSTVRFLYECETKVAEIPAKEVAGYLAKLQEMKDSLGDTLYRIDTGPGSILAQLNWLMIVVAGFGAAFALGGGFWFWQATRSPVGALVAPVPPLLPGKAPLQGLGGWLVLVGFGLCSSLVQRIMMLAKHWQGFFSTAAWQTIAIPGGECYHPLWGPLLIFEVLGNTLVFGLTALTVCLFFAKRRAFPKVFITLAVANAAVLLTDAIVSSKIAHLAENTQSATTDLWRAMIYALIWCPYMLRSERVKATFVR